ncbi:translation initiation factor IF-2-like [Motacilla alba alba]|uniref:translation initiation factor IF-2-like n=1 Tax=Motacilla alba alba TaxID=1094192 RepID=UPI0018D58336|nr:translation initiation factor IF-2-like [Motacilla alba alba]
MTHPLPGAPAEPRGPGAEFGARAGGADPHRGAPSPLPTPGADRGLPHPAAGAAAAAGQRGGQGGSGLGAEGMREEEEGEERERENPAARSARTLGLQHPLPREHRPQPRAAGEAELAPALPRDLREDFFGECWEAADPGLEPRISPGSLRGAFSGGEEPRSPLGRVPGGPRGAGPFEEIVLESPAGTGLFCPHHSVKRSQEHLI